MGRRGEDLTGRRFGMLLVLGPEKGPGRTLWRCRCDCGREKLIRPENLRSGATGSCGCAKRRWEPAELNRPYPPMTDCNRYDPETGSCRALTELLCATKGSCSFFREGKT